MYRPFQYCPDDAPAVAWWIPVANRPNGRRRPPRVGDSRPGGAVTTPSPKSRLDSFAEGAAGVGRAIARWLSPGDIDLEDFFAEVGRLVAHFVLELPMCLGLSPASRGPLEEVRTLRSPEFVYGRFGSGWVPPPRRRRTSSNLFHVTGFFGQSTIPGPLGILTNDYDVADRLSEWVA
jgi:hypothetical protein